MSLTGLLDIMFEPAHEASSHLTQNRETIQIPKQPAPWVTVLWKTGRSEKWGGKAEPVSTAARKSILLPALSLNCPNLPGLGCLERSLLVPEDESCQGSNCPKVWETNGKCKRSINSSKTKGLNLEPRLGANNFKTHTERTHPLQQA